MQGWEVRDARVRSNEASHVESSLATRTLLKNRQDFLHRNVSKTGST